MFMQGFWWFHKFVYNQHIIQSSVSFIPVLTFPLNFIIVVIILFTIIKALKNAQFINTLKRTVENLGCFKQTRNIFIPKTRKQDHYIILQGVSYHEIFNEIK